MYKFEDDTHVPVPFRSNDISKYVPDDKIDSSNPLTLRRTFKFSINELNDWSIFTLCVISKFADQHLKYDDLGILHHESMSAGEHAFGELKAYGLLEPTDQDTFSKRWTEHGLEVVLSFSQLGEFPGWGSEPSL